MIFEKHIRIAANICAVGGAMIGSLIVASNVGLAGLGYIIFLISSIASLWLLVKSKDAPFALILQNWWFTAVNIFGLIRHMA